MVLTGNGFQNFICVNCRRQFITNYEPHKGYSDEIRKECLKMYVNGMGFRGIEKVKGVHHTTIINWVKQISELLPNAYDPEAIPEVGELDELETFVGKKADAQTRNLSPLVSRAKRKIKFGFGQLLTTLKEVF